MPPSPDTPEQCWYDLDWTSQFNARQHSRTCFGGEALPIWDAGYAGVSGFPVFRGCTVGLDLHTGWWNPVLTDPDTFDVKSLTLNKSHPNKASEGSTCWFDLWSPGTFYAAQSDFTYNIGPDMFRESFLPAIVKQTEFLDHCNYHVDGGGNFRHVEALCEVPGIRAFQVAPGAGRPSAIHYMNTCTLVQAAGKNLWGSLETHEVEEALGTRSARGLFIHTYAETEQEAPELLKKVEQWSVDRE